MKTGLVLAGAGVAATLLLFAGEPAAPPVPVQPVPRRMGWSELAARVVAYVARGESNGKFWAQNLNTDDAGLSFGLLQWTQRSGSLGGLLRAFADRDPGAFAVIFGVAAPDLLRVTNAQNADDRMAPVGGAPLWTEPWTGRFTLAGRHGAFQQVQIERGAAGTWMQEARRIGTHFGIHTERAYTLYFNRANHMGYAARRVAESLPARSPLPAFAAACAARFRAVTPDAPGRSWRWVEEEDGGAWHRFAGGVDLYADIVRRTAKILSDTTLSDEPLTLVYP